MEHLLVKHCAPTLAGLKAAGMFTSPVGQGFDAELAALNRRLNGKDIYLLALRRGADRALIYVYRKSRLLKELKEEKTAAYLKACGYDCAGLSDYLRHLKERCACAAEFPHEIGFFLGYPPEDVIGFIENAGQNFKCCGCWKVYGNECRAAKLFERYNKCTHIYMDLFSRGRPLDRLAVAA